MNLDDLNKVWEIKTLKKKGEDEAKKILQNVAKQVQPIMKKHKWRVKILSEFCPANPSLLGLNVGGGAEIKLRLRKPDSDWDFFPYEQIFDTMLHELCHIEHGPHNANFYKLWDEIRKECEDFMAKGITGSGQGFDIPGRRLGGFSHQPPLSSLRKKVLAAAEKRARTNTLFPSGPKRIGGDSDIMNSLSPVQAAAMAAERRLHDDLWCGSQSCDTSGVREDKSGIVRGRGSSEGSSSSTTHLIYSSGEFPTNWNIHSIDSRIIDSSDAKASGPTSFINPDLIDRAIWECSVCTLFNEPLALVCGACGASKPKDSASKYKFWSCKFCTLQNNIKLEKCSACEQWRYSYGPPVSTRGPSMDT